MNRSMSPTSQSQAFNSFTQLGAFHNLTASIATNQSNANLQHQIQLGMMPTVAEDFLRLKKELRLKQAEYDKEKAILLQKNEQLESQLKETVIRQQVQVQMYETMINSLKTHDSPSQIIVAQIQASEKQSYEEEIAQLKEQKKKFQTDIDDKDKEISTLHSQNDGIIKELQLHVEKLLIEKSQQLFQWEVERKEIQQRQAQAIADREQSESLMELKFQNRIGEMQMEMERLKLENMREVDKIKGEYERSLREISILHEQEKQTLEQRLDRQSHDLKSLHHMVVQQDTATNDNKQNTQLHREQLHEEIFQIQEEVDSIRRQYDQTIEKLTKEKELAEERNQKLQKQLQKLKNAPKQPSSIKIDLPMQQERKQYMNSSEEDQSSQLLKKQIKNLKQEIELLQQENEKLTDQVKKCRKEAFEMQEYAEKLEINEKKLRQVLKEQTSLDQEQVVELRRQLNQEKKRVIEVSEVMSQAKEALERENYSQATQINEKDLQIRQLNREIKIHEQKLYGIQSMFNSQAIDQNGVMGQNNGMLPHQQVSQSQIGNNFLHYKGYNIMKPDLLMNPMNNSMHLPKLNYSQSFTCLNQHQIPIDHDFIKSHFRSIRQEIYLGGHQIVFECLHCSSIIQQHNNNDLADHIMVEHPEYFNQTAKQIKIQYTPQSSYQDMVCLTNRSQQNLNNTQEEFNVKSIITNTSQFNPLVTLQSNNKTQTIYQPQLQNHHTQGHHDVSPYIPHHHNHNSSIRNQKNHNQLGLSVNNSKSFNYLLKNIEEDHDVDQKVRTGIQVNNGIQIINDSGTDMLQNQEVMADRTTSKNNYSRQSKSRNSASTNKVSSATILKKSNSQTGLNNQQNRTSQILGKHSINSKKQMKDVPLTSKSTKPLKQVKETQSHEAKKKSISNEKTEAPPQSIKTEIKDLLDKLVSYQGSYEQKPTKSSLQRFQPNEQHSQSVQVILHENQPVRQKSKKQMMGSTESLVEIRSSASSLTLNKNSNSTKRDAVKNKQSELKQDSTKQFTYKGVSSVQQSIQSRQEMVGSSQVTSINRLKKQVKSQTQSNAHNSTQQLPINDLQVDVNDSEHSSPRQHENEGHSRSNSHSGQDSMDQYTASHDSKDTILTIPGRKRRGRRYHDVHKSDVLTPNSPRRYQNYFKNNLNQQEQGKFFFQEGIADTTTLKSAKLLNQAPTVIQNNVGNIQNHRYSPSNTKSQADESQYHQQSPSPEKQSQPSTKPKLFAEDKVRVLGSNLTNVPLQYNSQVKSNGSKPSSYQYRQFGTNDSGTVLQGGNSDIIFKTMPQQYNGPPMYQNLMFGGGLNDFKTQQQHQQFDQNMHIIGQEDDGEIRPSQLDEFREVKSEHNNNGRQYREQTVAAQSAGLPRQEGTITSSYISIGAEEDPFITGRFCDASTKQFSFKGNIEKNNSAGINQQHNTKKEQYL